MLGLGWSETVVILILGLIVIGPKQLPEVAKSIAKFINELKRTTNSIKNEFSDVGMNDLFKDNPMDPPSQPHQQLQHDEHAIEHHDHDHDHHFDDSDDFHHSHHHDDPHQDGDQLAFDISETNEDHSTVVTEQTAENVTDHSPLVTPEDSSDGTPEKKKYNG